MSGSNEPRIAGRHFLQIPGPSAVPDRILRAISSQTIDHRGPDFAKVGMQALALKNTTINEVKNAQTAKDLRAKGINLYEWSPEELAKYRAAVD